MLDPLAKDLAQGANFGTFTAVLPNGQLMTHVMWVDADDDHILINTEIHRAKYRAVMADPRVTVTVIDAANPYRYAEVRGRVTGTVGGQAARDHIDALARKYTGSDYAHHVQSERVILQITPERQRAKA
jgi:PPOX class probable F420-dependent enzyme